MLVRKTERLNIEWSSLSGKCKGKAQPFDLLQETPLEVMGYEPSSKVALSTGWLMA